MKLELGKRTVSYRACQRWKKPSDATREMATNSYCIRDDRSVELMMIYFILYKVGAIQCMGLNEGIKCSTWPSWAIRDATKKIK